ncbi:MAG TPA: RagB/SusD family nutrient uptake outer membrane protein [Longimicrobiales bacterium]
MHIIALLQRHCRWALASLACALLLSGCDLDDLLEAKDPFTVTPETASDTANLQTLYAGSRSQFALAFGGLQNNEGGIVLMSGLMSDELYSSDNFGTRRAVDSRNIDYQISNSASDHAFIYLQRARAEALNAIDLFEDSPRAGQAQHAELYSIAGYSVLMLVENFCAGIPLSRITQTGVEFGSPLNRNELYDLAIAYFDQALAQPDADAAQLNLARVGKARALLGLGRQADAAQVVANVPTDFEFSIEYAAGSFETPNPVFNLINEEHRISASIQEGTVNRGLPFGAQPRDPRIAIANQSVASNSGEVPNWMQLKYTSQDDEIPLATGVEARLIQAEAQLANGTSASYLATLNALRTPAGLAQLTDPGPAAGRVDQFFAERAYWLWLTGHRLNDMRRLVRQYGRSQETVFPTGVTPYGIQYGTAVSLPIPFEEINNPNYEVCTDRGA